MQKINEETGKYICEVCKKEFSKNGIGSHIWRMHTEAGKNLNPNKGFEDGTRQIWNKGLNKSNNESLKLASDKLKQRYESGELKQHNVGIPTSEKTKLKISESMKKYLDNNPDKVPYLLNHYSKGESFPEAYFRECFESNNIEFEQEKRIGRYSLDFYINNFDIEIDGEQHYTDEKIILSDIKRDKFLLNENIKTIRIRWSEFQRKNKIEKELFVKDLINQCF